MLRELRPGRPGRQWRRLSERATALGKRLEEGGKELDKIEQQLRTMELLGVKIDETVRSRALAAIREHKQIGDELASLERDRARTTSRTFARELVGQAVTIALYLVRATTAKQSRWCLTRPLP
jgi:hypothetical protein